MTDLTNFVLSGILRDITIGESEDRVRSMFGNPEHYEPAHKSYPTYMIYGPLEFRLRQGRVCYIGIAVNADAATRQPSHFTGMDEFLFRPLDDIQSLLIANDIDYSVDPIMSDESQTVMVTSEGVQLAFDDAKRLTKIASVE